MRSIDSKLAPDLPDGLLGRVVPVCLVNCRNQVGPQAWLDLEGLKSRMLLSIWHLDVEALLGIVLGEGLQVEHGAVVFLVEARTLARVTAYYLLMPTGCHVSVLADEAATADEYPETLGAQLELELDGAFTKFVLDFLL